MLNAQIEGPIEDILVNFFGADAYNKPKARIRLPNPLLIEFARTLLANLWQRVRNSAKRQYTKLQVGKVEAMNEYESMLIFRVLHRWATLIVLQSCARWTQTKVSLRTTCCLGCSDWHGFRQPAGFRVGVERGRVRVAFCVPGQYPYPQRGFYGFATGFQHLTMFINTGEYTLQSCYNVLSTLSSSSSTSCIP
jgi:hypothetical protein